MIFKATYQFSNSLLALPESGMGYQIIDAYQEGDYRSQRFVVYNSDLVVELDSNFVFCKRRIVAESYTKLFSKADVISLNRPTIVKREVMNTTRVFSQIKMSTNGRSNGTTGALDNPPKMGNGTDIFVRLSAYQDDKRIDFENKCLKAGSFTTTEMDYLTCKRYNDDPVDRYALPNDELIKWAFYIQPRSYDLYRTGVVQPANDKNGGGIEAYFDNGTSNGTYFDRKLY